MPTFLLLLTGFVSFLLIVIILLQRGRGGGLAGALGGMGGQSAFGTRAGDVFTRITVVLAIIWTVLAGLTGMAMQYDSGSLFGGGSQVQEELKSTSPDNTAPPLSSATGSAPVSTPEGSVPAISTPAASTTTPVVPVTPDLEKPAAAPVTGESIPPISTPAGSN